jgi:hypothetical protein
MAKGHSHAIEIVFKFLEKRLFHINLKFKLTENSCLTFNKLRMSDAIATTMLKTCQGAALSIFSRDSRVMIHKEDDYSFTLTRK